MKGIKSILIDRSSKVSLESRTYSFRHSQNAIMSNNICGIRKII